MERLTPSVEIRPLRIAGAAEVRPIVREDERGSFAEWLRLDHLEAAGFGFAIRQANISTSVRGAFRGVHFADVPPGQAKYVSVASGRILDYVVDIRPDSPTYRESVTVELTSVERNAVFLEAGLGHAFLALEDSTVCYFVSETYAPQHERTIDPLDPDLALHIPFGVGDIIMSARDREAPRLVELQRNGRLPRRGAESVGTAS